MTTNTFVPLAITSSPAGQSTNPNPQAIDLALSAQQNFSTLLRNRSYARLDASSITKANPEFDTGAAGRVLSSITNSNRGNDFRISRGYIRRSVIDSGDPTSGYRLYFMFNPEMIQRSYQSYLDQQALDPFNTIFGSNNLVAPPGALSFGFDLFFDRQTENASGVMPRGVLEDFDYFNLVVRGVVPDPQQPDLPDNGIMMINPRNCTVVFSPQLSVQGRPNTAYVQYLKFDSSMRPTRMMIHIDMMALYIGPVRTDFTFAQSKVEGTVSATVPYEDSNTYQLTQEQVQFAKVQAIAFATSGGADAANPVNSVNGVIAGPNSALRINAMGFAEYILGDHRIRYTGSPGSPVPVDLSQGGTDCAGLVYWGYRSTGALAALLGSPTSPPGEYASGNVMWDAARRMGTIVAENNTFNPDFFNNGLQPGDIMIGAPHVAWCHSVPGDGTIITYECNPPDGVCHEVFPYSQITGGPNYHRVAIRPGINNTVTNP
jgi:hypothetical protein